MGKADFSGSTYEKDATFSTPIFRSTYVGKADFRGSTYKGKADFSGSTYEKDATFSTPIFRSTYVGKADFRGSTYKGKADFSGSTYEGEADFRGSIYEKDVIFSTSVFDTTFNLRSPTYRGSADPGGSTYKGKADFRGSTYKGKADFRGSTYEGAANFIKSIFYSETYFGKDGSSNSSSCFTNHAPQFYDEKKNTIFGSLENDFTVDTNKGYSIDLNSERIPLKCKFLTPEDKGYFDYIFQEIKNTSNRFLKAKNPTEKTKLSKNLSFLNEEFYEWQEEITTLL